MSTIVPPANDRSTTRELPPYRAVLVVDARSFSANPDRMQAELNTEIQQALAAAFIRAGLAQAWQDRRFAGHTGDGYIVGLEPDLLPYLIDPLLGELQSELHERDYRRRAWEPRLRLRASIHVGPLPDQGQPNDGVGKAMTDTHRLLDSDRVRQLLERTHEDVTFVAAIVSRRAYEDAVEGGYTGLHMALFVPVEATAKRFADIAYLHVPTPSGPLLAVGIAGDQAAPTEPSPGASVDAPEAPPGAGSRAAASASTGPPTSSSERWSAATKCWERRPSLACWQPDGWTTPSSSRSRRHILSRPAMPRRRPSWTAGAWWCCTDRRAPASARPVSVS
jgi:hypothetical protein